MAAEGSPRTQTHVQAMSTYLTVWYVSPSLLPKLDIETFLMWKGLTRMFAIDLAFGLGFWYISHNLNWILWHLTRHIGDVFIFFHLLTVTVHPQGTRKARTCVSLSSGDIMFIVGAKAYINVMNNIQALVWHAFKYWIGHWIGSCPSLCLARNIAVILRHLHLLPWSTDMNTFSYIDSFILRKLARYQIYGFIYIFGTLNLS